MDCRPQGENAEEGKEDQEDEEVEKREREEEKRRERGGKNRRVLADVRIELIYAVGFGKRRSGLRSMSRTMRWVCVKLVITSRGFAAMEWGKSG